MNIPTDASSSLSKVETPVPSMDPVAVHRWAQRIPTSSAWLHEEVGARMVQRLGWIKAQPTSWLSWEPVLAGIQAHRAVSLCYPKAQAVIHSVRPAHALALLKAAAHEAAGLIGRWRYTSPALADASVSADMVWANMVLHATHLPQTLLKKWHSALRPNGFLMFSCLGPDSLMELRRVYAELGWSAPSHAFTDMHDWGDMLVRAGFAEPVMDMERVTLSFSGSKALLADLRALGGNLGIGRNQTTRGRAWMSDWHASMEAHMPRSADGRMSLTVELIYGHAHKGSPKMLVSQSSAMSLKGMRDMLGFNRSRGAMNDHAAK